MFGGPSLSPALSNLRASLVHLDLQNISQSSPCPHGSNLCPVFPTLHVAVTSRPAGALVSALYSFQRTLSVVAPLSLRNPNPILSLSCRRVVCHHLGARVLQSSSRLFLGTPSSHAPHLQQLGPLPVRLFSACKTWPVSSLLEVSLFPRWEDSFSMLPLHLPSLHAGAADRTALGWILRWAPPPAAGSFIPSARGPTCSIYLIRAGHRNKCPAGWSSC